MLKKAALPMREDGWARKKWSVTECKFLTDNGLLEPGSYELIEGEIIFKMAQDQSHIIGITAAATILTEIFGGMALIHQANIGIGERDEFNDPEPDVAVVVGSIRDYKTRRPDPSTEVLLLIEIANTSFTGDTTIKAEIYARHGLRDYWVVAINKRELIVHRNPTADGYADVRTYAVGESVAPLARPDSLIAVTDLLP